MFKSMLVVYINTLPLYQNRIDLLVFIWLFEEKEKIHKHEDVASTTKSIEILDYEVPYIDPGKFVKM